MNLPLIFQPEVREEIDDAYMWYEDRRIGLGEEFLAEVQTVLDRIQQNPELHARIYRDVRRALLKRFSYAVYYRVEPERIEVIAVHHSANVTHIVSDRGSNQQRQRTRCASR